MTLKLVYLSCILHAWCILKGRRKNTGKKMARKGNKSLSCKTMFKLTAVFFIYVKPKQ